MIEGTTIPERTAVQVFNRVISDRRSNAQMSSDEVAIEVRLTNVLGALMDGSSRRDDVTPNFDVNVKLEEVERRTGEAIFNFAVAINTKPSVARFDVTGTATVKGGTDTIEKLLQTDPETKVPHLLKRVYQHIFLSVFLLSAIINGPHPPPDLIFSSVKSRLVKPEEKSED